MIQPAARTPGPARPGSVKTARQQEQFDELAEEQAELQREANVLRDMMLAQLKADDEAMRKFIAMIGG